MSADAATIEHFYGVYLLYCTNPKYLGRTYIGYTVDPNRRIKQHNKGTKAGGAWKTSNRGPWSMVLIVYGFPNDIAALRFEWAWQHPLRSRRLNHLPKKKAREKTYDYNLRILSEMLRVGPWNRLPLTVNWLSTEFKRDFPITSPPPVHMPITQGAIKAKKLKKLSQENEVADSIVQICGICNKVIESRHLICLNSNCNLTSHANCLSKYFIEAADEYIPVEGECPKCKNTYLWGDLVRKSKGCYENLSEFNIDPDCADEFYCSQNDDC